MQVLLRADGAQIESPLIPADEILNSYATIRAHRLAQLLPDRDYRRPGECRVNQEQL